MRRSDREIKTFDEIVNVITKCDVCRLAINDEGFPYILPLNFGTEIVDGRIILYFHGAMQGKKYELLKKDNRASFEMDCSHRIVTDEKRGTCTMEYESVIGRGRVEIVSEEEKYHGLCVLMKQYQREDLQFDKSVIAQTCVLKLTAEEVIGKVRKKLKTEPADLKKK